MRDTDEEHEPEHTHSATYDAMTALELHGYRPAEGEPDLRPPPMPDVLEGLVAEMFDGIAFALDDTSLAADLPDLLWSLVNVFHRGAERLERRLTANEDAQKAGQKLQDGSEIRSVELERLIAEGQTLLDRRDAIEALRDLAVGRYEQLLGTPWRPYSGSLVNRRTLTAAVIASRDHIAERRRTEREVMLPKGPKIAFSSGTDYNDVNAIWACLDDLRKRYPDMVLLHGGTPAGGECIAERWARDRKVPAISFTPDWTRHRNAAPFKRNDLVLDQMPVGVVVTPGTGIQENMADKARRRGIPLRRLGRGGK
jgi:hypothetical protein